MCGRSLWSSCLSCFQLVYRCLSFPVELLRHVHLRLTMILRVDARSATAHKNTSHAVTRPRKNIENICLRKRVKDHHPQPTPHHFPHTTATPEAPRSGRHRAPASMPRVSFVRGLRVVSSGCVGARWFEEYNAEVNGRRSAGLCACTWEVLGCCRMASCIWV